MLCAKSHKGYFSPVHILKGMSVVDSMDIPCEICECNIRKSGRAKRVKTKKHLDGTLQIGKSNVGNVGAFRFWTGSLKIMLLVICLAQRKRWRDKTPDKVRDGQRIGKK